jgi:hypothetical protein
MYPKISDPRSRIRIELIIEFEKFALFGDLSRFRVRVGVNLQGFPTFEFCAESKFVFYGPLRPLRSACEDDNSR